MTEKNLTLKDKKIFLNNFNYNKNKSIKWYPFLKELIMVSDGVKFHYHIGKKPLPYHSNEFVVFLKAKNYDQLFNVLYIYLWQNDQLGTIKWA